MARSAKPQPKPSLASKLKPYIIPSILLAAALVFQLVIVPISFPTSHYDVLGIKREASVEEVNQAYERLSSKWKSGDKAGSTAEFIKIQYAFELLTNPLWKRDYDLYGIDEQIHVLEEAKAKYAGQLVPDIKLLSSSGNNVNAFNAITTKDFRSKFQTSEPWIVQIYSYGSIRCSQFFDNWNAITALLDGVTKNGMIELGEHELVTYLAEKKSSGKPYFRNGVPSVIGFPAGCRSAECVVRFEGELSVDAVTNWFTSAILRLPQIYYYPKETLGRSFIANSRPHKVKIIVFSEKGERATPQLRKIAKVYWDYVSFAFVLWKKEDFSIWWTSFGVESAPALVVLKDPGVKPIVYHQGLEDHSSLVKIIEENKNQELLQLRSTTYKELGCDPKGYSRAGLDTTIWYCVVVAGRLGPELNKMRETLRRVQEMVSDEANEGATPAAQALKEKRLAFAWLDGEFQRDYCTYYLGPESFETCGERRVATDIAKLYIVRYGRNITEEKPKKKSNVWQVMREEDMDPVSQLVAKYNGSEDSSEITKWISEIIKAGDTDKLPFFRTQTPALTREEEDPLPIPQSSSHDGIGQKLKNILLQVLENPMVGPFLLMGAFMSFTGVFMKSREPTGPSPLEQPSPSADVSDPPSAQTTAREKKRSATRRKGKQGQAPPSITDAEPKDAVQMPFSDSDS